MRRRRWSAPAALALVAIASAWAATGLGVYLALASHRSALADRAGRPENVQVKSTPLQRLPGTLYLVQDGTLYRLQHGTFTPLLRAAGTVTWTMPAVSPSGQSLVVVRRDYAFSDLYLVDTAGHVQSQLTHDANMTIEFNHWALYPRLSADGSTLWFSYDPKDVYNDYNVVMPVWSMPLGGSPGQMRKWTIPNDYTGGDVQPLPLPSGGVIYTKYALDPALNKIMGQLWMTTRAGSPGRALTSAADDCSQPALSPDGRRLAMICTAGIQLATVDVATIEGTSLGPLRVIASGQLAAQPTWSPDGTSIVYLAAQGITGHFQLWLQEIPPLPPTSEPSPTPSPTRPAATPAPTPLPPPIELTTNLDFDATSTIAWHV